jgi:transposase
MGTLRSDTSQYLRNRSPKIWEPGLVFMQENAPIHTAHAVANLFQDQVIPVLDRPPYSPDLNPIEHIWWHLKAKVKELFPDLDKLDSGEEAVEAF